MGVPRFEPFTALRFSPPLPLDAVAAPPYDVLSDADVDALLARHPRNIVAIDVPRDADGPQRYELAAQRLAQWVSEATLERDAQPSFTLYRMRFTDETGRERETVGVVGALEVVDEGAPGVIRLIQRCRGRLLGHLGVAVGGFRTSGRSQRGSQHRLGILFHPDSHFEGVKTVAQVIAQGEETVPFRGQSIGGHGSIGGAAARLPRLPEPGAISEESLSEHGHKGAGKPGKKRLWLAFRPPHRTLRPEEIEERNVPLFYGTRFSTSRKKCSLNNCFFLLFTQAFSVGVNLS